MAEKILAFRKAEIAYPEGADLPERGQKVTATLVGIVREADVKDKVYEDGKTKRPHVPEGRERSLAITKLEEAMFWANAGIARPGGKADG